jgi:hypothetical protein
MTIEKKIEPEDDLFYEFREGIMHVFAEKKENRTKSRLEFGGPKEVWGIHKEYPYLVFLEDLKKLQQYTFPWRFKEINDYTVARRTITGGLQVMRTKRTQKMFSDTATFSREEYQTIKQILELYFK